MKRLSMKRSLKKRAIIDSLHLHRLKKYSKKRNLQSKKRNLRHKKRNLRSNKKTFKRKNRKFGSMSNPASFSKKIYTNFDRQVLKRTKKSPGEKYSKIGAPVLKLSNNIDQHNINKFINENERKKADSINMAKKYNKIDESNDSYFKKLFRKGKTYIANDLASDNVLDLIYLTRKTNEHVPYSPGREKEYQKWIQGMNRKYAKPRRFKFMEDNSSSMDKVNKVAKAGIMGIRICRLCDLIPESYHYGPFAVCQKCNNAPIRKINQAFDLYTLGTGKYASDIPSDVTDYVSRKAIESYGKPEHVDPKKERKYFHLRKQMFDHISSFDKKNLKPTFKRQQVETYGKEQARLHNMLMDIKIPKSTDPIDID